MTRSARRWSRQGAGGTPAAFPAATYEIRLAGHLDDHWAATLDGLVLARHEDGTTSLTGPVRDQAQLHGLLLLARVRDIGVPLLTVRTIDAGAGTAHTATARGNVRAWGGAVECGSRRVLHPGRWLWLRAAAWFLLLFFATGAAFGLPLQWAADHGPAAGGWQLVGTVLACVAALCAYAVAVRIGEGREVDELALRPAGRELTVGLALGVVLMAALMGAMAVSGLYDVAVARAAPPWTGLSVALQAAVTEELWMRALLLRLVWRVFGALPALAVSAVAFAGLHLANPGATALSTATVATAGLMFSGLYLLTGRLWVPIGLHLAWNATQGYVFGAAVSGGDLGGSLLVSTPAGGAPRWLTGGAFGPEASLYALVLVGLVVAATFWAERRRVRRGTAPQRP